MVKVTKLEHCSEQEIDEFFQDDQQKKELLKEEWAREHGFYGVRTRKVMFFCY